LATLFKLAITAETITTVSTKPNVQKLFYTFKSEHVSEGNLTIPANAFVDDQGDSITEIPLVTSSNNGYYMLFINGVLQQESLYTVTTANVQIPGIGDVQTDTPIILVVTNFTPDADSQTTIAT
jgi:hypothetical protein